MRVDRKWVERNLGFDPIATPPPDANTHNFAKLSRKMRRGCPALQAKRLGALQTPQSTEKWCGKKVVPERIRRRLGWSAIPAVQANRIVEIKSPLILQPGPAALTDGLDAILLALGLASRDDEARARKH